MVGKQSDHQRPISRGWKAKPVQGKVAESLGDKWKRNTCALSRRIGNRSKDRNLDTLFNIETDRERVCPKGAIFERMCTRKVITCWVEWVGCWAGGGDAWCLDRSKRLFQRNVCSPSGQVANCSKIMQPRSRYDGFSNGEIVAVEELAAASRSWPGVN